MSGDITEADIERERLREWLDDHDVRLMLAHNKISRLRAKLAGLEGKCAGLRDLIDDAVGEAAELQRAYDAAWEDYNELGGPHIEALFAENQGD
jgi:hypothetical protein